jgi:hypothetical protein
MTNIQGCLFGEEMTIEGAFGVAPKEHFLVT